ncbi:MAG TPA: hypothetical protein DCX25_02790 [Candidatus Pacebacteria bacterium]|nr:MAG: hypothetical protein UX00_C0004G0019 [Microgenomates group bacterium GW2011_GWB1_45_17]KKU23983.1 MAG: hypothetical protein UX35_C0003G0119 [Microgenomates group bacterium GW2011_GWA1_46_15]KKU24624.1 MAG: hypothetical protein UX36_C0001G0241 [Microgenomates group bacterium GW2011_GWC1_46_15]HAV15231.1 hypothetical protein [Candidatus Paceibacterota bacterium]HCR10946.1 hypothetical protein [Candidatus Paceibacterota bacterium]
MGKRLVDAEPTELQDERREFYAMTGAKETEILDAIRLQFPTVTPPERILALIALKNGSGTVCGFQRNGGISRGLISQNDLERFIQEQRRKLSLPAATITKPRPKAGMPGVDWSITVKV